jgi:DnaJ-class molecular chaperone
MLRRCFGLAILAALAVAIDDPGDLYEILGIADAATDAEIKRAYRQMSLKHHPDKGGDPKRFTEISFAYEVLSDGEKRSLYDAGGMAAVEKGVGQTDFFGRPTGVQKGPEVSVTVKVPLAAVYSGDTVNVQVTRRVVCRGCRAAAARASSKCAGCGPSCPDETKTVQRRMGHMLINQEVATPSEERCKDEAATVVAEVEPGMAEDTRVSFERMSEQSPGRIPGDVVVILRTEAHATFVRDGADLLMTLQLPLKQALGGFRHEIRHLDDHVVVIQNDGVSHPGQVLTLPGEGLPLHNVPSEFGALRVTLRIAFPKALTAAERAFVAANFQDDSGGVG